MPEFNNSSLRADPNLKLYLRLEETSGVAVADASGNGNNGVATRTNILNNVGKFGNGGVFVSGSSDKINITNHASLRPAGGYSLGAWIKSSTGGVYQLIFSSFNAAQNIGVQMMIRQSDNKLIFGNDGTFATAPNNVTDGEWHFVVGTSDGTNLKIYVDGLLVNTQAFGNPTYFATNYVIVGARDDGLYFNGSIDDLFLLNGTVLSADQIRVLMSNGREIMSTPLFLDANLKYLYRFEDYIETKAGNNLNNANGVVFNTGGKYGNSADFGATNTNRRLYTHTLNLTYAEMGSNWSLSFWIYMHTTPSAQVRVWDNNGWNGNNRSMTFYIDVPMVLHITGYPNSGGASWDAAAPIAFVTGVWYHVAVTFQNGGNVILYVDGVPGTPGGASWGTDNNNYGAINDTVFGATTVSSLYASIKLDDFAVFTRLLTPAEILTIAKVKSSAGFFNLL